MCKYKTFYRIQTNISHGRRLDLPLAREAKIPKTQRITKMMNVVLMLVMNPAEW